MRGPRDCQEPRSLRRLESYGRAKTDYLATMSANRKMRHHIFPFSLQERAFGKGSEQISFGVRIGPLRFRQFLLKRVGSWLLQLTDPSFYRTRLVKFLAADLPSRLHSSLVCRDPPAFHRNCESLSPLPATAFVSAFSNRGPCDPTSC
jgi:hypothetical protein